MKKSKVEKLPLGLYEIHWKRDGGMTLASVGVMHDGSRWMAPCNWSWPAIIRSCPGTHKLSAWKHVNKVVLIREL